MSKFDEISALITELETECDSIEYTIQQAHKLMPESESVRLMLETFETKLDNQRGMIEHLKELVEKYLKK